MNETKRCLECGCSEYADCNLRKYCNEYEIDITKFIGETKKYKIDDRHPFIIFDPNKCINCGKCVRTCSEILKVSALGFVNRGFKTIVRPSMEKALMETNCITCGNCIDVCPTGSITEKFPFKVLGTLEKANIKTICNFCSMGCKVNFKRVSDNIYWVSNSTTEIEESHNKGYLCAKGRFGHRYLYQQNRQFNSVIKDKSQYHEVSIDDAIKHIAEKLKKIIAEYGAESIAIMASPKLSNEELYLLQKFARVGLKNNNINRFSNNLNNYDLFDLDKTLGFTTSTTTSDSLDQADVIVVINANLSDDALVMELKIKSAKKKGSKLILINSSELELTKYSDLWIDSKKGTNTILFNGVNNHLIENDSIDKQFVENKIDNFYELKLKLAEYTDDAVINSTEIHQNRYESLIRFLQNPDLNIVFIYNIDSTKNRSHNELSAITNFFLLTGRINKANNGLIILREFNNSAGFIDMGAVPEYLPGFVKNDSKQEINRIADLWHSSLVDIFIPVDLNNKLRFGAIKALLVFGEDPLFIDKNRKFFNDIEFLVVSDSFRTNIMNEADVILPASTFIENDGSYTNCDHVVQKAERVVKSKLVYNNWEIITKLASFFSDQFDYKTNDDILKEICNVNRFYKHADNGKSIIDEFSNQYFQDRIFHLADFDTNLTDFDPFKPRLHYQENYYIANIKMQLI